MPTPVRSKTAIRACDSRSEWWNDVKVVGRCRGTLLGSLFLVIVTTMNRELYTAEKEEGVCCNFLVMIVTL